MTTLDRTDAATALPTEIRGHQAPACLLCGAPGRLLYETQRDYLFGAPGVWNIRACTNSDCGLIWPDPLPDESDIGKAYATYYTHPGAATPTASLNAAVDAWRKYIRPVVSLLSIAHHQRKRISLMHLEGVTPGTLLDVGCGSGARLAELRDLGWNVYGQDVDPTAVAHARTAHRLDVRLGSLDHVGFADAFFDCVISSHVIEHVHDPVRLLKECRRLLKPGGRLVLVTPNSRSLGHRYFRECWYGLDPPRHLALFAPNTLATVVKQAGFNTVHSSTTAANANVFAFGSLLRRNLGRLPTDLTTRLVNHAHIIGFQCYALFRRWTDLNSGEECVVEAIN